MNEIQIFKNSDFGEIRTVEIDGEAWFVGVDIARALGYRNLTNAVNNNVDEGDSLKKGVSDRNGHTQQAIVINESGLYSLIFGSKLESAKKFKRWVTSEVLPTLHRKGTYSIQSDSNVETLRLHYNAIMEINDKTDRNKAEIETVRAEINELKYDIPIFSADEKKLSNIVRRRASKCMGGCRSNAFKDKSLRRSVFHLIYGEVHRQLEVASCKFIKRGQFDLAVDIVKSWEPDAVMQDRIEMCNAQMNIYIKQEKCYNSIV